MKDKKRGLDKLERVTKGDEVRVIVYRGNEKRPEPESGARVIKLTWGDDDNIVANRPAGLRKAQHVFLRC